MMRMSYVIKGAKVTCRTTGEHRGRYCHFGDVQFSKIIFAPI